MANKFTRKKNEIIEQLSASDVLYTDRSPKGSVDEGIRDLVEKVNELEQYVTTSSCAGRIAVFVEGATRLESLSSDSAPLPTSTSQGKGGGHWLYVSHDPIDTEAVGQPSKLFEMFGIRDLAISYPPAGQPYRFVHLKFEPMILHLLAADLEHAQIAYSAAMTAGFRESGIGGSVFNRGVKSNPSDTNNGSSPMIAVRTTGLAFDSIIGYQDAGGVVRPMVPESYLHVLVRTANDRFQINTERKQRFAEALCESYPAHDGWEPPDVRRARKRAEGLQRQREAAQAKDDQVEPTDAGMDLDLSCGLHLRDDM